MGKMTQAMSRRRFVGALGALGVGGAGLGLYKATGSSQFFDDESDDREQNQPSSHEEHQSADHDDHDVDWEEMD
jgi:hypothetical protein